MKDKKAAKKLIKLAKKHPDWYTKQEAWYAKMIKDEMSSVKDSDLHSFSLPLSVDINVGDNWDDLH